MRSRTTITTAVTVATILACAVPAGAAAAHRLTPAGSSTQNDYYVPLAGSASTLVLTRQPHYPRDVNLSATAEPPYSSAPREIYLRSASGSLRALGVQPNSAENDFDLVGTTLSTGKRVDDDTSDTNEAYVWHTATGKRTEINLPDGSLYLGAAPDGVLFGSATGQLKVRGVDGTITTLATPFGATTRDNIISAAVDATGAVVTDLTGHIAWVGFAAPHTVRTLQNPAPAVPMLCSAVDSTYAACATAGSDDAGYIPSSPILVPLDGGAPTVDSTTNSGCADMASIALVGSTEVWTCYSLTTSTSNSYVLRSLTAGALLPLDSSVPVGFALVSAYGKAVGVTLVNDALYQATTALSGANLIPATPSPVATDYFALTSSALIYSDNQRVASRPGQTESVFTRTVHATATGLRTSAAKLVDPTATGVTGNLLGISSALTVYATKSTSANGYGNAVLHVITKGRTATIPGVIGQGQIQVSGTRVLFQAARNGRSDVYVYDATSGKSKLFRKVGGLDYHGFALSGHYVSYATKHGAIYRQDLVTGRRTQLRKGLPHDPGGVEFDVYAQGSWVGWHALPVQSELAKPLNQIRNAKTMAPTITLAHTLYSLTSAGAILSSTHATFRMGFAEAGQVNQATRFWLREYSGSTRSLLPRASYLSGPQIAGKVLAWADGSGILRDRLLAS